MVFKNKEDKEEKHKGEGTYYLDYDLTKEQLKASNFILKEIINKRSCILNAITGAGKTEIIYPLIKYCIDNELKICIAIPRKDVVIELKQRISKDFKNATVIGVYGGCNSKIYGDVVVATTHQLYRYENYFDVVIVDEVDAFPFYKNQLLNHFLNRCLKGNIVYMSATIPIDLMKKGYNIYYLNRRYHNEKLDVPKVKYLFGNSSIKKYIRRYKTGILLVYFPTIRSQISFSRKLKIKHYVINSHKKNREELLNLLHQQDNAIVLTTLVLERGITFKNSNVIVVNADHELFSFENLVQISGRVGRHYLFTHGDIIFLAKNKSKTIKKAIDFIKRRNE